MGSGIHDLSSVMPESTYDQVFDDMPTLHNFYNFDQNSFFDPSTVTANPSPFLDTPNINVSSASSFSTSSSTAAPAAEAESSDDSEMSSDILFTYINRILMEEDIDTKFDQYPDDPALLAAEKPFLEILEKLPTSPDQPPLDSNHSSDSPNESIRDYYVNSNDSPNGVVTVENSWPYDPIEYYQLQNPPSFVDQSSQLSFSSANSGENIFEGLGDLVQNQPAWHFARGYEEAQKFLPSDDKLVINLEANGFSLPLEVKEENEEENQVHGVRWGRKNRYSEDLSLEEGRSNKQTALYSEEIETEACREMFDKVLLFDVETSAKNMKELREAMQSDATRHSQSNHSKGSANGKGRGKKQPKQDMVDLRTLLIHCAQAVASDDYRSANELLKQIRQHSSRTGDATQRLAHCVADSLQARLAGTGSEIYRSLVAKRISTVTILKAYQVFLAASPFKKLSFFFSNQTIFDTVEGAKRVHIIDYGIAYGFQWPCLLKRLSDRPGGPPALRITGIDLPRPGFRPAELIEETGRRLADYARSFNIPFDYRAIAAKWETIRVEDLNIDKDEVVIVNSLYQFRQLMDETVVADSPRDIVLNTIKKINPAVFIHGIVNGSYGAPFFVTRFREALFHFSAIFDMLDATIPREHEQRVQIEDCVLGREVHNVISCEGSERVNRPETYKQWQVRNLRAGFKQLKLNADLMMKMREKVKLHYHKDFIVDEDNKWLLQGWKGRILYALSAWKPNDAR